MYRKTPINYNITMEHLELTLLELRTLHKVLETLVTRKILPPAPTLIIAGIVKQIDQRDVGDKN